MNEQQLADLFSEQIDRILQGETSHVAPDIDDLQELLELGNQILQTKFQVGSAIHAVFQSQLAS